MGPRNRVLDGRAYWRHLANTVERLCVVAMSEYADRGGDAACPKLLCAIFLVYSVVSYLRECNVQDIFETFQFVAHDQL